MGLRCRGSDEPDADHGRGFFVRSLQDSSDCEGLAEQRDLTGLGVLTQMLDPEIRLQHLSFCGGIPQCRKESRFEPSDRMRRREQVVPQFLGVDSSTFRAGKEHVPILPSSSDCRCSRMANASDEPRRSCDRPSADGSIASLRRGSR